MAIRDRIGLTEPQERVLVRVLQLVLVGIVLFGVLTGRSSVAINAAGAVLVSLLPALIRREVGLHVDAGIVLWLTAAVLLHAIGIMGPYREVGWWDYLTHAFSASILAGIAYAVVRSIDRHSERIHLPEPFLTVFLFLFVLALGVFWEVLEFGVTAGSQALGTQSPLIIFGVSDIITDLVFSGLGGLAVILWGRGSFRALGAKFGYVISRRRGE